MTKDDFMPAGHGRVLVWSDPVGNVQRAARMGRPQHSPGAHYLFALTEKKLKKVLTVMPEYRPIRMSHGRPPPCPWTPQTRDCQGPVVQ